LKVETVIALMLGCIPSINACDNNYRIGKFFFGKGNK